MLMCEHPKFRTLKPYCFKIRHKFWLPLQLLPFKYQSEHFGKESQLWDSLYQTGTKFSNSTGLQEHFQFSAGISILLRIFKLPSVCWPLGNEDEDGKRSGMSSADKPSTESTTDLGRNFLPCRLFRLFDKCGVAWRNDNITHEARFLLSTIRNVS